MAQQEEKKYLSESGLLRLIELIKSGFAALTHKHKLEDIEDYVVDTELSSTSTNPVENRVISTELNVITDIVDELESAIEKIDMTNYYTKAEVNNLEFITVDDIDAICNTSIQLASEEGVVF